ncbi:MAG: transcription-repair coupling factor [Candidatus Sumerlaeota bacterium]|nr:transcription-repair coupling factor [Candidatus Sumerlaeota bacterium]
MNKFQKYLLDRLSLSVRFRETREFFESNNKWAAARGLFGSAVSYLAAGLANQRAYPIAILTAKPEQAEEIYDNLLYFGIERVFHYPKWDILPYEEEEPVAEIRAKHAETLHALLSWKEGRSLDAPPPVVVAPCDALLQWIAPPAFFAARTLRLKWGEAVNTESLAARLTESGYDRTAMVESRGEFSIRGGIIDIFPIEAEQPLRIDLFGDEIESVRWFDVYTQRSTSDVDMEQPLHILPARLNAMIAATLASDRSDASDPSDQSDKHKKPAAGALGCFTDYLSQGARLLLEGAENHRAAAEAYSDIVQREWIAAQSEHDAGHRADAPQNPERLYLTGHALEERLIAFQRLSTYFILPVEAANASRLIEFDTHSFDNIAPDLDHYLTLIRERQAEDYLINIACDNDGQAMRLKEILAGHEIGAQTISEKDAAAESFSERRAIEGYQDVILTTGALGNGCQWPGARVILLTDREIFGRYKRRHIYRKLYKGRPIASAADIQRGDLVIHVDHGLGRYMGLRIQEVDGKQTEFLEIQYEDAGRLLVPIDKIRYVQKFSTPSEGAPEPKLDSLGGKRWEKRKQKAQKAIEEMAGELLELYARRAVARGYSYNPDSVWQTEFEASFIYRETPDQIKAIADTKADMMSDKPMDRLICGDVGFGKTEVAIRAAFKAVQEGRQVAILAPTTILVQQHYNTFRERFADYPIRVDMLSRFRTEAEHRATIEGIKNGHVNVVIGTHRLLSKDIVFADLGLAVIDEEQRFGVRQKERLKEMRASVDVLTLTATPIPRTLHMALSGIRDMSLINTPPADRLPIKTRVIHFDKEQIAEAILRELNRGGQIYFVHNRIFNIEQVAKQILEIVPRARIAIAHGQMPDNELEDVMTAFVAGDYDMLLSTTIIENGLDIPNVNTIIINRADAFGLAQLYQLRGRVGRDVKRAYAYLIVPAGQPITDDAVKRLQAIEEFTELGVGFNIAMRDMEIRGVGNILGARQHGVLEEIGFELYCQMLEEAVRKMKGETTVAATAAEIRWNQTAVLPRSYVPVEPQRIAIYKRLAGARSVAELEDIQAEVRDHYGEPPEAVANLIGICKLRVAAAGAGLARVGATMFGFKLTPMDSIAASRDNLFALISDVRKFTDARPKDIKQIKASGAGELDIILEPKARPRALALAIELCKALAS